MRAESSPKKEKKFLADHHFFVIFSITPDPQGADGLRKIPVCPALKIFLGCLATLQSGTTLSINFASSRFGCGPSNLSIWFSLSTLNIKLVRGHVRAFPAIASPACKQLTILWVSRPVARPVHRRVLHLRVKLANHHPTFLLASLPHDSKAR